MVSFWTPPLNAWRVRSDDWRFCRKNGAEKHQEANPGKGLNAAARKWPHPAGGRPETRLSPRKHAQHACLTVPPRGPKRGSSGESGSSGPGSFSRRQAQKGEKRNPRWPSITGGR